MRIALFISLLLASACARAQVLTYYGFTGFNPDVYTTATSNDGATWTNAGGTWNTAVNSPSVMYYQGKVILLLANATDTTQTLTTIQVGIVQPDKSVASFPKVELQGFVNGATSVFAGRWFVDSAGLPHAIIPIKNGAGNYQIYEMHPLDYFSTWSIPVLISVSGAGSSVYDPVVYQVGSTFYLYSTKFQSGCGDVGGFGCSTCVSTASDLLGPYTKVYCGGVDAQFASLNEPTFVYEGPGIINVNSASSWELYIERRSGLVGNFLASCSTPIPTSCTLGTVSAWTMDQTYRAGTILRTPLNIASVGASSAF